MSSNTNKLIQTDEYGVETTREAGLFNSEGLQTAPAQKWLDWLFVWLKK